MKTHPKGRQARCLAEPGRADQPLGQRRVEAEPVQRRRVEPATVEQRRVEWRPVEWRPVEWRPVEWRPVEWRPAERRPVERAQGERQLVEEREPAEARAAFRQSPTLRRGMGDSALLSDKPFRLVPATLSLYFGQPTPISAETDADTRFWSGGTGQRIRSTFGQDISLVRAPLVSSSSHPSKRR